MQKPCRLKYRPHFEKCVESRQFDPEEAWNLLRVEWRRSFGVARGAENRKGHRHLKGYQHHRTRRYRWRELAGALQRSVANHRFEVQRTSSVMQMLDPIRHDIGNARQKGANEKPNKSRKREWQSACLEFDDQLFYIFNGGYLLSMPV